jgi:uncharacterized protein (DUF362 family)
MKNKPLVSIARNEDVEMAVAEALNRIKLPNLNGKRILLKPNVAREVEANTAINTNPAVVKAVFEYLFKRFKAEFFLGDSPIVLSETHRAFEKAGYKELMADPWLKYLDLDEPPPLKLEIPNGLIIKSTRVTGYWPHFDYIISIPVLKMHMHTGASLSFKNCKGLLYKRDKVLLHHQQAPEVVEPMQKINPRVKELDIAIGDLSLVIQPHLAIIDATFALEGLGPSSGNAKKMDTIIASTDFLAADIVALALTQPAWSLDHVPHLKSIADRREPNGPYTISDINIQPSDITPFIVQLEAPPKSITIQYPNVTVIDKESCSACVATLFMFLKNNQEFINAHFTQDHPLNLVIGRGIRAADLYEPAFLIGNCTACRQNDGIFIKGCAPVESVIRQAIEEHLDSCKEPNN